MKTKNYSKNMIIAVITVLTVCLFSIPAFAETGKKQSPQAISQTGTVTPNEDKQEDPANTTADPSEKSRTGRPSRPDSGKGSPTGDAKSSNAPQSRHGRPSPSGSGKESRTGADRSNTPQSKHGLPEGRGNNKGPRGIDQNRPGRFEGRNEDRIGARKHRIDFSELPEDPTDEEILEFFRKYFPGKDPAQNEKDGNGNNGSLVPAPKDDPADTGEQNAAPEAGSETGPVVTEEPTETVPTEEPEAADSKDAI